MNYKIKGGKIMEKEIKNEWKIFGKKLRENSRKEFKGSIFGTKIKIEAVYDVIFEFMNPNTSIWGNMKKIPEFVAELAKALEPGLEDENLSRDAFWRYFDFKNGIFSLLDNTRYFEELNQKMKSGYFFED